MADTSITYNVFAKFHGDEGKMQRFGRAAAVVGVAVGALAVKFGKDSVSAFVDAQESQKKLQFAFSKFPALADTNIEALRNLNTSLARKTKFDDDNIASGQAVLAQFKLTGSQLKSVTPLLLDYASKMGKDVPTAAMDVGKALLGNAKALKNIGISYKSTGNATQDYANITALMREKVGGFASQEGKTAAGQAAILKNQFGELEEGVGSKLVPVLTKLATILLQVIGFIQQNSAVLGPLAAVVGVVVVGIWAMTAATAALNTVMALNPIGLVVIAIAALVVGLILAYKHSETFRNIVQGAMQGVVTAFHWVLDAAQAVFGWIKSNWPLILGFLTGPFGLAIAIIATHWGQIKDKASAMVDTIGNIVRKIWDPIKAGFQVVRDWVAGRWAAFKDWVSGWSPNFSALWSGIKDAWSNVREWVAGRWDAFKAWVSGWAPSFSGMFDGIKTAFRSAINAVIGWWNNLHFSIPGISAGPIHVPGVSINTPNIPYLAQGGIVTGPTLAVLGEAGPEAVVPLSRAGDLGGGDTHVHIHAQVIGDRQAVIRWVRDGIAEGQRRRGEATIAPGGK